MKKIHLILALQCAVICTQAQITYFNNLYPNSDGQNAVFTNVIVDSIDQTYRIIGVTGVSGNHQLLQKRLHLNGEFLDEQAVFFGDTSLFPGIAESFIKIDDGYLATYAYYLGGLVEKYDENWQRIWRYEVANTDTSGSFFQASTKLNDGSWLCAGLSILQYNDVIGDDAAPIELVKLSDQGLEIWRKQIYPERLFSRIMSIHELSNGDIILTGTQSWDYDAIVLRTDHLGNVLWQQTFQSPTEEERDDLWAQSVLVDDSTLVVSYGYGYDDEIPNSPQTDYASSVRNLHLVEFNINTQQINWEKTYPEIYSSQHYNNDLIRTPDNGYAVVGSLVHNPIYWPIDSLYYGYTFSYLAKMDENGELLWRRNFKYSQDTTSYAAEENLLFDVENTTDGGFVACGYVLDYNPSPYYDAWVIKLDEFGCLEPGCQNVSVDEIILDTQGALSLYPNPVQSTAIVQINLHQSKLSGLSSSSSCILTDIQGRHLQNIPIYPFSQSTQITIDVSHLSHGIYQLHWIDGKSLLDSIQLVKE